MVPMGTQIACYHVEIDIWLAVAGHSPKPRVEGSFILTFEPRCGLFPCSFLLSLKIDISRLPTARISPWEISVVALPRSLLSGLDLRWS